MSFATATALAVSHLTSELAAHAGGVGDGEAPAGTPAYPFHIVYNISEIRNDPGFLDDDGMFETVIQVTTGATTRQLRDLAADAVSEAMLVSPVASALTASGETLTVIGRVFDVRANDDIQEGRVFSVAQRFLWLCAVAPTP